MIRLVMESIRPNIEAVTWVERYGGLAYPITVQEVTGDTETVNKTFPFSDYVSDLGDCELSERYHYLTPDDSKKSIVYFEQTGDMTFSNLAKGGARLRGVLRGQQNFRLVCWVNLNKIGSEITSDGSILAAELWAAIDGVKVDKLHPDLNLPVTNLKWYVTSQVAKSMAIFSPYSYQDRGSFLMYPFEFFAFNVQAEFYVKKGCITPYPVSAEVCVDMDAPAFLASFGGGVLGNFGDDPLAPL